MKQITQIFFEGKSPTLKLKKLNHLLRVPAIFFVLALEVVSEVP